MRALAMLFLLAIPLYKTVTSLPAAEKKATITYLQSLQNADGGFAAVLMKDSDLGSTSAALRALRLLGVAPKDMAKCRAYVNACFDGRAFGPRPNAPRDVRSTAMGVMAFDALGNPGRPQMQTSAAFLEKNSKSFEDIRIAVAAFESAKMKPRTAEVWIAEITKTQNDDGTFGTGGPATRDTGGAVVALLRLGVKFSTGKTQAITYTLKDGQQEDGGFSRDAKSASDLETSYRVMRAFHMLKIKPEVPKLRAFIKTCRNADGGYGVTAGQPSSPSGSYFALTILSWID